MCEELRGGMIGTWKGREAVICKDGGIRGRGQGEGPHHHMSLPSAVV